MFFTLLPLGYLFAAPPRRAQGLLPDDDKQGKFNLRSPPSRRRQIQGLDDGDMNKASREAICRTRVRECWRQERRTHTATIYTWPR